MQTKMRKLLLILGCIITATSINAQYNTNGLYNNHFTFDKAAFIPSKLGDNNARFEMRILPNTYLYAGNTFMSIDDILYPTTSRINEIVDDASDANRIGVGTEAPWFAFSYKIKSNDKELLTVGLTSKARAFSNTSLGGNMLRLLWRGNKQFAGQTVDLGKFELNAFAATEIGLTLAVPFKIGNTKAAVFPVPVCPTITILLFCISTSSSLTVGCNNLL